MSYSITKASGHAAKPLSSMRIPLSASSAVKHLLVFKDVVEIGSGPLALAELTDRVSGGVLDLGYYTYITRNTDNSITLQNAIGTVDFAPGWEEPNSKTLVSVSMFGNTNAGFIIAGSTSIGAGGSGQGIRTNRNVLSVTGDNLADFNATAPALTTVGAIQAVRFTPNVSINSMQANEVTTVLNTENTTTPAGPIDNLAAEALIINGVPLWALLVLHFDNPPSDTVIAQGIAWLRPHWLAGEFDLLPPMWKDYT